MMLEKGPCRLFKYQKYLSTPMKHIYIGQMNSGAAIIGNIDYSVGRQHQ